MNFTKFESDMKACRYCFMCRHLSAVGNVLFSEADTPRGRALMLYTASHNPEFLFTDDVIETMYRSDLSACCRFHCVSHYDENSLVLAARRDIVEAGKAPAKVAGLAEKYAQDSQFKTEGKADVLYFVDAYTDEEGSVASAFAAIAKAANVEYATISGGCIGKALKVLGYENEAKKAAENFAAAVNASGAKILVVSNPAAYDAVKNDFPAWGIKVNAEVMHTSQFIAKLLADKALKAVDAKAEVYYLESDFLKNYNDNISAPRDILAAFGFTLKPFGTNNEESYSAGEGACVLKELHPELVTKLAKKVASRADNPEKDLLITASPYTAIVLKKEAGLNVATIEEVIASQL